MCIRDRQIVRPEAGKRVAQRGKLPARRKFYQRKAPGHASHCLLYTSYPQAQVSRLAGAGLWEALMQRAGAEGTPVFLVGGKPEVLAQT